MKNPIEKLKEIAIGKGTAILLRKAAAGDFGGAVKWAYWNFRGIKTWVAAGFAFAAGAIEAGQRSGLCELLAAQWPSVDCAGWLESVKWASASVAAGFLYLGQVDGALHEDAPEPARR